MENETLSGVLRVLEERLKRLLVHYHQQQATIQQLKEDNKILKQELVQAQSIRSFPSPLKLGTITGMGGVDGLGERIEYCIKVLDESIRHLEDLQ